MARPPVAGPAFIFFPARSNAAVGSHTPHPRCPAGQTGLGRVCAVGRRERGCCVPRKDRFPARGAGGARHSRGGGGRGGVWGEDATATGSQRAASVRAALEGGGEGGGREDSGRGLASRGATARRCSRVRRAGDGGGGVGGMDGPAGGAAVVGMRGCGGGAGVTPGAAAVATPRVGTGIRWRRAPKGVRGRAPLSASRRRCRPHTASRPADGHTWCRWVEGRAPPVGGGQPAHLSAGGVVAQGCGRRGAKAARTSGGRPTPHSRWG